MKDRSIESLLERFPTDGTEDTGFRRQLYRLTTVEERVRYAEEAALREPDEGTERNLLILLQDRSPLVKAEAADSLCLFCSERVFRALMGKADSEYSLVRAYAMRSLGEAAPEQCRMEAIRFLEDRLAAEETAFVKIQILLSLCTLGADGFSALFGMYPRCGYRNRCAILNGLSDLAEERCIPDKSKVMRFLNVWKTSEEAAAVRSAGHRLRASLTGE